MKRCSNTPNVSMASKLQSLEVERGRVRRCRRRTERRPACGPRACDRQRSTLSRSAAERPAARRNIARRGLRTSLPRDRCRWLVCACRRRSPALGGNHARGARKHRRVARHASSARRRARMAPPIRPCWWRRGCAASLACSKSVARKRSPRWPTARRAFQRSTRSSAPATPGSRRPRCSSANDPDGAALDLPAGPSEVLVIADERAESRVRRR